MAIIIDKTFPSGLIIRGAYIKVGRFAGTKSAVSATVEAFISKQASEEGKEAIQPLTNFQFTPSIEDGAPNIIKQAYLYLKTLPEFEGAVDA